MSWEFSLWKPIIVIEWELENIEIEEKSLAKKGNTNNVVTQYYLVKQRNWISSVNIEPISQWSANEGNAKVGGELEIMEKRVDEKSQSWLRAAFWF